jgi:cellulose synthase/poly-beta-1,6-N-acetylglucosamine synthase-like glycosyltransferase
MFFEIIFGIFVGSLLIQIIFWCIYARIIFCKPETAAPEDIPVSVIISAKNEAENLQRHLPKVLKQNYLNYEVIVINDNSSDQSSSVLETFQKNYPILKYVEIHKNEGLSGKKDALTHAVSIAANEHLVFIDADCYPVSENWLKEISSAYTTDKEIILAYGGYETRKGFLNKMIRYETLIIALQYMSYALIGKAYMGVGRNLSYKKSLFLKNKGFESHKEIISGDDDLFVNQTSNKNNVGVIRTPDSITRSIPEKSFRDLLKQKRRHVQTARYYKPAHKFLLLSELFSRFFFYSSLLVLMISNLNPLYPLLGLLFKLIVQTFVTGFFSKILNEKKVLIFIPIFDILIPIINLYVGIESYFNTNRNYKWK